MIQLLGNCFGQEASTLYTGMACAFAVEQIPSVIKQRLIENEATFAHPFRLATEITSE
jgi:hypothetical protein